MATFKYNEVFDGNVSDLFNVFMTEAVQPFDHALPGYIGTKQSTERQGRVFETEITGYLSSGLYQVTVRMPGQEYVKQYTFTPAGPEQVRINYEETFHTNKPVLALNNWLMSYIMKKSLKLKVSLALESLRYKRYP